MNEVETNSFSPLASFKVPLFPKLVFWADLILAVIVGKITKDNGGASSIFAILIFFPLLANALLLLKVKFAFIAGYARVVVLIGVFLYLIRNDLSHLDKFQMVINAIVLGYNLFYALMVFWYTQRQKSFLKSLT